MAHLSTQQITDGGEVITLASATGGGDTFDPGEKTMIRVKNGDSGSHTVTIHAQTPCNQGTLHDLVVAVAAGATKEIGPLPGSRFADAGGLGHATYDAVTSVTVGMVKV